MAYLHSHAEVAPAAWFAERLAEQRSAHTGEALRVWATALMSEMPAGPVELLSTSTEGCALAAVIAALRESAPTRWRRLTLGRPYEATDGFTTVVVEAVELGSGLQAAIARSLPDAKIIAGVAKRPRLDLVA